MAERPQNDPVLTRFRAAVTEIYGKRAERIVLFGSRARGEAKRSPISITTLPFSSRTLERSPTRARALPPSAQTFFWTRAQ